MTNREIVDIYLSSRGMALAHGGQTLEPILPLIMLDAMYQIYCSDIRGVTFHHEQKKWKNLWAENYERLNREFFRAFSIDQQCEITDIMDDFEKCINNDIMVAKVQIMNILQDIETEAANICASLMLCNILAQSAGIVWEHVYVQPNGKPERNPYINSIERCTSKLMNAYHKNFSDRSVNPNQSRPLTNAVNILCRKMIKWLYQDIGDEVVDNPISITTKSKESIL